MAAGAPSVKARGFPANLPFAPQAVCARGAYASPKTLNLAKFGFVGCIIYGCDLLCTGAVGLIEKPSVNQLIS